MSIVAPVIVVAAAVVAASLVLRVVRTRARWRRVLGGPSATAGARRGAAVLQLVPPRWRPIVAAAALAGLGVAASGPVAGALLGVYAGAGMRMLGRRTTARESARSRATAIDAVAALAADLRAGVPVGVSVEAAERVVRDLPPAGAGPVWGRLTAAVGLAESSGAPLADVLDRLDAHLRAVDRARASADAQAAGARASAALLAALPVAGVGLGVLIGIDAAHVLLHTPIGAACACGAAVLQLAGLAWSNRLSRVEVLA